MDTPIDKDCRSIAPNWRCFTEEELRSEKKPRLYQRIDKPHAFWFGVFCLLAVIANARQHDLLSISIFSALGGIAFYIAYISIRPLAEATICRITIDGIDFGYRWDTGDLKDFLSSRFPGREIQIERTDYWVLR